MEGARLQKALGYRPGQRIAWVDAPEAFPKALGTLPTGTEHADRDLDCVHIFLREGDCDLWAWVRRLGPHGCIWISWPDDAGPLDADDVRDIGRAAGLTDVKQVQAPGWGAIKFVPPRRPSLRASMLG